MDPIYNLGIATYRNAVKIAAVRNPKAKLMLRGQRRCFRTLQRKLDPAGGYIWIHASSLGEFEQGRPLIEKIKREQPDARILLSFFSPSGYEVRKNFSMVDTVVYLPFDLPYNVKKFLDIVKPTMAIFVKYEFWGNYLTTLKHRGIPTYIISAIFRPKQIFFKPWGGIFRKMLKCFNTLFVQNEQSRELLAGIGVDNVIVAGDTRFDRVADVRAAAKEFPLVAKFVENANFTLVMGSSWPPDEDIVIPYFNAHREMKLIIAPHEFDRHRLHVLMSKLSRPARFYSEATPQNVANADCLIIDSFGLLSSLYRYGQAAYVGGGFGAGIHNINEAAVYGIPVIFGPKHHKFQEASDLIALDGAMSIHDADTFSAAMDPLLENEPLRLHCGKTAGNYIQTHLGGTQLIYDHIFNNATNNDDSSDSKQDSLKNPMRKPLFLRQLACFACLLVMMSAAAEDFWHNGLHYVVTGSNTVAVTSSLDNTYSGAITIPETITVDNGSVTNYTVTAIGDNAFSECNDLTSVVVPNTVMSVGECAFYSCLFLTSVDLPNSVSSIGKKAFYNCQKLQSVTIPTSMNEIKDSTFVSCFALTSISVPNSVTSIGNAVFASCWTLKEVALSNSVEAIGDLAFANCYALSSVVFSSNLTTIGNKAFRMCSALTNITIPASVTTIGDEAFACCEGLTDISIPASVTSLSSQAFLECTALTSITVDAKNPVYDSREGCNAIIETSSNTLIIGCQTTFIPNSVTIVGPQAFWMCDRLEHIDIPGSVIAIGDEAFYNCTRLTEVVIPNSVTYLGDRVFMNCSGLTNVELPNSITAISNGLFHKCTSLTCISIPASVSVIKEMAFYYCSMLDSLTLPTTLKTIEAEAFEWCAKLTFINIPASVTTIGDNAFGHCRKLTSIAIPNSVTNLGTGVFNSCSRLDNVTLPTSITTIPDYTFAYCWGMTTAIIPSTIDAIGDCAYYDCTEITSLTCRATTPPVVYNNDAFSDVYTIATLYVPASAVQAYKAANVWKNFLTIVGVENMFTPGDVDGNGSINISDVTELIDLLLQGTATQIPAGDVDGDGIVNISDVTELIDYLLLH